MHLWHKYNFINGRWYVRNYAYFISLYWVLFCIYAGFRIYKISYLNKIESAKNSKELVETYQRLLEDPGRLVVSLLRQNYPRMSDDDSTFSQTLMHKQ